MSVVCLSGKLTKLLNASIYKKYFILKALCFSNVAQKCFSTVPLKCFSAIPQKCFSTVPQKCFLSVPQKYFSAVPQKCFSTVPQKCFSTVPQKCSKITLTSMTHFNRKIATTGHNLLMLWLNNLCFITSCRLWPL